MRQATYQESEPDGMTTASVRLYLSESNHDLQRLQQPVEGDQGGTWTEMHKSDEPNAVHEISW